MIKLQKTFSTIGKQLGVSQILFKLKHLSIMTKKTLNYTFYKQYKFLVVILYSLFWFSTVSSFLYAN